MKIKKGSITAFFLYYKTVYNSKHLCWRLRLVKASGSSTAAYFESINIYDIYSSLVGEIFPIITWLNKRTVNTALIAKWNYGVALFITRGNCQTAG